MRPLNWILPRHGGGWVRRYLAFRQDMYKRTWETKDLYPCLPIPLFDYTRPHDAADAALLPNDKHQDAWRISDDRVIGGYSVSHAAFFSTRQDYDAHVAPMAGNDNPREVHVVSDSNKAAAGAALGQETNDTPETNDDGFIPFLRWQGTLNTTIGLQSNVQRSGFAALRSPEFPLDGANLQGLYNALELTCRPDNRVYTVNLKISSSIPDDIYQKEFGRFENRSVEYSDPEAFDRFVLPFSSFRLTANGRDREVFRQLDDNICIESIGVALMDGRDGDFTFDLRRIRAVNVHEDYGVFDKIPGQETSG